MAATLVEHVVADAGAFLKKAPLQDIGATIYTLKDVVEEIRDKNTRRSLSVLPYQLNFKEPYPEHIRFVTEFSKKTGDYPSLSATDIKVLALTYQLELEQVGSDHLKKEPEVKVHVQNTQRHPEAPVNVAGFHFPSRVNLITPKKAGDGRQTPARSHSVLHAEDGEFNSFQFWRDPLPCIASDLLEWLADEGRRSSGVEDRPRAGEEELQQTEYCEREQGRELSEEDEIEEDEDEDEEEEEEDDGEGWITPSNLKQVQLESGDWTAPADIKVGCLTTDFAMQNVLIQIGLHVLSVNGMLIKQARNYILRCHACFKTTTNMTKAFCPHCGNKTLKKIAVTINEDGSTQMHFSRNPKVLNPKGLKYALPLPRGGKHANNPHLVEDQRFPQQRLSRKARQKTNVYDPDYVSGSSPFRENDITSRAANLQISDGRGGGGRQRTNPNATRKKFVKK
ncbi:RNA-binding protein NOB1 isoform X1 [Gadus macrocephalus]|uniref:RNA-binding protein NOB1 isoform X1 n=1 Tax=Gadus macrocephalus TaxID=80720 RepID=UPI0028CB8E25|nr:RNA-binding protein NOB1 isoform X1 [Gadus macrocephalus]